MKRRTSFIIIFIIYVIAFVVGLITFKLLKSDNFVIKIIIADIAATLVVWLFGVFLKNSSVYDPYWSVAPMVIIPFFVKSIDIKSVLMLSVIFAWGIRLTYNWAFTFKGLNHEDWRYAYYKNKAPRFWPLTNLFGINLMPTIVVILVMLPSFQYLQNDILINNFTYLGALICLFAILLELVADMQRHAFKKTNPGQIIDVGLWKYSRHPNYLGEILMWWGVFVMLFSLSTSTYALYLIGPLANTLMFVVISIPLMEKRQLLNKPEYSYYKSKTSMLLLLPSREIEEESVLKEA